MTELLHNSNDPQGAGAGRGFLRRSEIWVAFALLMAAGFGVFANTFGHPWIYDDFPVIVNNPDVRSLDAFFKNSYPGRPLREFTYLFDHALFGMDPAGWRIQNIFWHGLNAFLVWVLTWRLTRTRAVSWVAASFFLVHPLQVEVVANISHRKDSLALAFCLLALLSYMEIFRAEARRGLWFAASVLLAFVAILAKMNALVLPLLFVVYEASFVDPEKRLLFRKKKQFAGVAIASVLAGSVWFFFLGGRGIYREGIPPLLIKMNHLSGADVAVYYGLVLKSLAYMFQKFFLPLNLAPEYTFSVSGGWSDPFVLCALGGLALFAALLGYTFRRHPVVFFALVWIGFFWVPVSNLWPLSYFAADRYLYAPLVGLSLLVAFALHKLFGEKLLLFTAMTALLILPLAFLTIKQNQIWRSPLALWSQAAEVSPESTWALNNLGAAYMLEGKYANALPLFQKAAKNFNDSKTLYNVGWAYEKLGDTKSAIRYYRMFISMNEPKYRMEIWSLRQRLGWR